MKVVGLLLAGGQSRRMGGGDKALRLLGGIPLLARVIERLRPQVVVVAGVCKWVVEGFKRVGRVNPELEGVAVPLILDRDEHAIRPRVPEQPDVESVVETPIQLARHRLSCCGHDRLLSQMLRH